MDYDINVTILEEKSSEFGELKAKVNNLVEEISQLSSGLVGEISSLSNKIDEDSKRITNEYDNCDKWFKDYLNDLSTLEDSLASFSCEGLDATKEFKDEFIDLKGKKVIPTLKNGGDKDANLKLDNLRTTIGDALSWIEETASNNTHGYSQITRWGNPNYDCSSFVISAWKAAGIDVNATYTGDMREEFLATGQFEWIPGPVDSSTLQPGDILLNEVSHTAMYFGDGKNVGVHSNKDSVYGNSFANEINIQNYCDDNWDGILRCTS